MKEMQHYLQQFPKPLWAVLSGGLLGIAFLHSWLWWTAVIGGVVLCLSITRLSSTRSAWWYGWLIGGVKILVVTAWGWYVLPLDWMGFTSPVVEIVLFVSFWCLSAVALGVGYALASAALWHLQQWNDHFIWPSIALLFLLADGVGSLVFSLVMSGPGSSLNIQYANGWMGFVLAEHNLLLATAQMGGVYVLSLLFGALVAGLWYLYEKRQYLWGGIGLLLLVLTSAVPVLFYESKEEYTVAVVHTEFAREPKVTEAMREERRANYLAAMNALADQPVDYVLWPEDTRLRGRLDVSGDWLLYLKETLGESTVVIDTARRDRTITTLRAYISDPEAYTTYQFDKGYLVPQGEYVPYIYRLVATLFGGNPQLMHVLSDMNYQPGIDQRLATLPAHVPAVLFCFESIDPRGVRRVIKERSEVPFVAHVISHAWFQRPPQILWHQLDSMLRVQAVWAGVPIIQAANQAPNKIYLPDGTSRVLPADITGNKWSVSYVSI